jgi:hypothetical protein
MVYKAKIGNIDQYGLISYIVLLIFVFICCFKVSSLQTLMFFAGVGGGVGNIAYLWGILMLFTVIRYFEENKERFL